MVRNINKNMTYQYQGVLVLLHEYYKFWGYGVIHIQTLCLDPLLNTVISKFLVTLLDEKKERKGLVVMMH